ncbi:ABC transporter substrate-binding protein [Martelella sp. HB161492]|uniref:ABC transporter substrate-binding protein n=1 Tax=Martelella sp. HB161492 TaxID=2720726 RepID=UPI001FEDD3FC|nr:ABC transporter substrate-binding protein [Martelella sp. HB161492]
MTFCHVRQRLLAVVSMTCAALALTGPSIAADFPYVDDNCGITNVYEKAPEHAVTLSNNATELMLALGLQDHMAGTSYMAALKISPQYSEAYNAVPVLSPLVATTEQLVDANADFVYAGYPDGFSESRHSRAQLQDLGMKTHLNPEGCNLGQFGFDGLFDEIRSIAGIFGVPERGDALIGAISERLDAIDAKLAGADAVPVFIFNGGESAPNAVLGNAMLSDVVKRAGGQNIFGDVDNRFGQVSWEQVADRNPEAIVVFYSGTAGGKVVTDPDGALGQARIDILKATPTIAGTDAIENGRFIPISSVLGQPGPSSIDAVERLARAFHPDVFAD